MEAYFDNSATTQVFDCVKDAVVNAMTMDYGNAAARHMKDYKRSQKRDSQFTEGSGKRNPVHIRRDRIEQPGADWDGPGESEDWKTSDYKRGGTSVRI